MQKMLQANDGDSNSSVVTTNSTLTEEVGGKGLRFHRIQASKELSRIAAMSPHATRHKDRGVRDEAINKFAQDYGVSRDQVLDLIPKFRGGDPTAVEHLHALVVVPKDIS